MIYGVIGVGALATALVTGLCSSNDAPEIVLSPRNAERGAALADRFASVRVAADNQAVLDAADVVLLCVRPQDAEAVLGPLRFRAEHVVISAMAGVQVDPLVAPAERVTRVTPLPSVAERAGITPIHPPEPTARALFERLGEAIELEDLDAFEAFSATTATIAAHFAYLDAIAGWLTSRGVDPAVATRYVAAAFAGLTVDSGEPFSHLAADHATRGGINEQFRGALERAGVFEEVRGGLDEHPGPPGWLRSDDRGGAEGMSAFN